MGLGTLSPDKGMRKVSGVGNQGPISRRDFYVIGGNLKYGAELGSRLSRWARRPFDVKWPAHDDEGLRRSLSGLSRGLSNQNGPSGAMCVWAVRRRGQG